MDKLKTFITRYRLGPFPRSPRIMAKNWNDAGLQCPPELEVTVILVEEIVFHGLMILFQWMRE